MLKIKEMTLDEFYNKDKNIFNLTFQNLEEEEMENRYKRESERARKFYFIMINYCKQQLDVPCIGDIQLMNKIIDFSDALSLFCTNEDLPDSFLYLLFRDEISRIQKEDDDK